MNEGKVGAPFQYSNVQIHRQQQQRSGGESINLVELSCMTLADILKVFMSFPSSTINAVATTSFGNMQR
jgi:hypothetical protein